MSHTRARLVLFSTCIGAVACGAGRDTSASSANAITVEERSFFDQWGSTVADAYCDDPRGYMRVCFPQVRSCRDTFLAAYRRCSVDEIAKARPLVEHNDAPSAGVLVLDCANAALDRSLASQRAGSQTCTDLRTRILSNGR
jgi:hypothetical protein